MLFQMLEIVHALYIVPIVIMGNTNNYRGLLCTCNPQALPLVYSILQEISIKKAQLN